MPPVWAETTSMDQEAEVVFITVHTCTWGADWVLHLQALEPSLSVGAQSH